MAENVIPESNEIFVSSGVDITGVVLTGSPAYSFVSDSNTGIFTPGALAATIQAVSSGTWFLPPTGVGFSLNSAFWTFDGTIIPITSAGPVISYNGTGINGSGESYGYNPYLQYDKLIQQVDVVVEVKPEVEIDPTDIFEIF